MALKNLDFVKIAFIAIIAILAISNLWTYVSLQGQVSSVVAEVNSLILSYNNLNQSYHNLNDTYINYVSAHSYSDNEYETLLSIYNNYMENHSYSNSEYEALNITYQDLNSTYQNLLIIYEEYVNTHLFTNTEYEELENERDLLRAPKLSWLSIYFEDIRPFGEEPYAHIYGEVWNVGTDPAYNCELIITAYTGSIKVIDNVVIQLGTINGEDKVSVDENIIYSGESITGYFITALWTIIP